MLARGVGWLLWYHLPILSCVQSRKIPCGPSDCADVQCSGLVKQNQTRYTVQLVNNKESLAVVCDVSTHGGGWTVFQKRVNGLVNFSRTWKAYKEGFGDDVEFWLGNKYIHQLTTGREMVLRIEMFDKRTRKYKYAYYDGFSVGNEMSGYKLDLGSYLTERSNARDSLSSQNGESFSTCSRESASMRAHCRVKCGGGWWYNGCNASAVLNGLWPAGVHWLDRNSNGSLSRMQIGRSTMQFRPTWFMPGHPPCRLHCPNGGLCRTTSTPGDYKCLCAEGFYGWTCNLKTDSSGLDRTLYICAVILTVVIELGVWYAVTVYVARRKRRAAARREVEQQKMQVLLRYCESWRSFVQARTSKKAKIARADSDTRWDTLDFRSWERSVAEETPLRQCSAYRGHDRYSTFCSSSAPALCASPQTQQLATVLAENTNTAEIIPKKRHEFKINER